MVSIGLVMIMKDEEAVLPRVLNSIIPIIEHYTIIDTGSTDSSKQIVKDFFDSKGIKGEIHDHPWVNYGDARNYALEKAKGKTDFNFTIDCDNVLNLSDGFDIAKFKEELSKIDLGIIQVSTGNIIYGQRAFYRNYKAFKYNFPTHEVLECDEPFTETKLTDISVTLFPEGKSWQNVKEKFLTNAHILTKYIEEYGMVPRAIFYLAESYKDAGEPEKAIEWYQQRVMINGGFFEERYWSQFMIAQLKLELNYPLWEVADEFMRCGEFDDLRAEHLFNLKLIYQENVRPKSAMQIEKLLSEYYDKNPYPQRILFVNPKVYSRPS